jgi:DnaJ domain
VDYEQCHEILGVEPGASLRQVHAAYKKLALKHHPDRAPDDPASHDVFIRVTEAYSILKNAHHQAKGSPIRITRFKRCPRCGQNGLLVKGLDGGIYCVECLLGRRRKYLPLPVLEVIRCIGVIGLEALAVYLVVQACITGERSLFFAAGASCLIGFGLMAINVWSADVIKR